MKSHGATQQRNWDLSPGCSNLRVLVCRHQAGGHPPPPGMEDTLLPKQRAAHYRAEMLAPKGPGASPEAPTHLRSNSR